MSDPVTRTNEAIREASPALFEALSPLGLRSAFPADIPFQAAQARGKTFNGTIGQVTDGAGRALALPSAQRALAGLADAERNRAFLYSPVEGIPEVRRLWREWQRRAESGLGPSTLPIVTAGLTHGLSLVADLFGGPGRPVAVPTPFWGNYRQTFANRTGAEILTAPAFRDGVCDPCAIETALAGAASGVPALAILNLPSNPGGYSLTVDERRRTSEALVRVAEERPLIVVCDDAYAGLVYEEDVPARSMFWDLMDLHPRLVPVKVDGATKELSFFGGRVGFLTFPFEEGSEAALALESKVKCLVRATIGSPVAASQMVVHEILASGEAAAEVEAVRRELAARYRTLARALDGTDRRLLAPLPFNSGCFALVSLPAGVDPEAARRHLLDRQDTGLVSIQPSFLRIAYCSVAVPALPELVRRLEAGVGELA